MPAAGYSRAEWDRRGLTRRDNAVTAGALEVPRTKYRDGDRRGTCNVTRFRCGRLADRGTRAACLTCGISRRPTPLRAPPGDATQCEQDEFCFRQRAGGPLAGGPAGQAVPALAWRRRSGRPQIPSCRSAACLGRGNMLQDLTVLTPPGLVCAAFLVAVIAFLRHEMGRKRRSADVSPDDNSDELLIPGGDADPVRAGEDASDHREAS